MSPTWAPASVITAPATPVTSRCISPATVSTGSFTPGTMSARVGGKLTLPAPLRLPNSSPLPVGRRARPSLHRSIPPRLRRSMKTARCRVICSGWTGTRWESTPITPAMALTGLCGRNRSIPLEPPRPGSPGTLPGITGMIQSGWERVTSFSGTVTTTPGPPSPRAGSRRRWRPPPAPPPEISTSTTASSSGTTRARR